MRKNAIILFGALLILTNKAFAQQTTPPDSLNIWLTLAEEHVNKGSWTEANAAYLAAQGFAKKSNDNYALCRIQAGFAKIAASSSNNEDLKKAIELAKNYCFACNDSLHIARIYIYSGILNYNLAQFDSSAMCFIKASEMYKAMKDTIRYANAIVKVGNVLEGQEKFQQANVYYLQYYEFAKKQSKPTPLRDANIYLAGNYMYLEEPQKVLVHALEARRLSEQLDSKFEYSVTLEYEAGAYNLMGQNEKAYECMRRYAHYYRDTMLNAEKVEQMEALRTQYETAQKETQIELQAAQLTAQQRTIWGTGTVLVIALLAGGLLFRLTRQLRKRNTEKEFLIKEIHHRVKNNLQVLSSLLHLQSRQITDETALDAVREGQNRVDAMSLIHQKLYMGDNLAGVEMQDYLRDLGETLVDSFGKEAQVTIHYQLDAMHLDVDTAIPLGLIINELLTNSLKYAFPTGTKGDITLALWKEDSNKLCLKVSDNGKGTLAEVTPRTSTSFGSNLVQILSKKLKGKPEITANENGYATFIRFEAIKLV